MHLPTGPTAVYHHLPSSPLQSDWNSNITHSSKSASIILDSQQHSTSSETTTSPLGSATSSQDLWWTERMVLEAQQEFPGELGIYSIIQNSFISNIHTKKQKKTKHMHFLISFSKSLRTHVFNQNHIRFYIQ